MLTRENILSGYVQRMVAQADAGMRVLTEPELEESIRDTLAKRPEGAAVWVFGYGSLIWNPAFHFAERRKGTIRGFHRRFCLWTHLGRGTPEQPGLVLGLDRGGSCRGVVYRIAEEAVWEEMNVIWRREMVSNAYRPTWLSTQTPDGPVHAVGFVMNRGHERYAGKLPEDIVVRTLACAGGRLGPCSEYLINTVAHLEELGIGDRQLQRLRDLVVAQCGEQPAAADAPALREVKA